MTTATASSAPSAESGSATAEPLIVYFSSVSGNTERFVEKLGMRAQRIPLYKRDDALEVNEPFVLISPTYGGGNGEGAVPKQVIRFLNDEGNRRWIRGVISTGNTNFGDAYCIGGDIISRKCKVPHLDRVELFGTPEDVSRVTRGLEKWWKQQ
ncbi:class Ib ribonucleoside-diphosphate reductase assembly flavoprotein NrdI [Microbacterium nanhaiense]|nr:class Ib ribonucleoside-diphosphate reductase assembly flavoprotein NrdI [Microbacterium nanhaiense]